MVDEKPQRKETPPAGVSGWGSLCRDAQKVGAEAQQGRVVLRQANGGQQAFPAGGVGPLFLKAGGEPGAALQGEQARPVKPDLLHLGLQLFRPVEVGLGDKVGVLRRAAVLPGFHLSPDHVPVDGVVQEVVLLAVDRQGPGQGAEGGDARRCHQAPRRQHPIGLPEGLEAASLLQQVVEGAQQQNSIGAAIGQGQLPGVPHQGGVGGGLVGSGVLHSGGGQLHHGDLVPQASQPVGVIPHAAANVVNGGFLRQPAQQEFLGAGGLQLANAPLQPSNLRAFFVKVVSLPVDLHGFAPLFWPIIPCGSVRDKKEGGRHHQISHAEAGG